MKGLIRFYIAETLSLYLVSQITSGLVFDHGSQTLLIAGGFLMLSRIIVKPIINILILPLNLLTFGFFKWVAAVVAIYIVTLIVPGFHITTFSFMGLSSKWLDIPSFQVGGFFAYIAYSFVISLFSTSLLWLVK